MPITVLSYFVANTIYMQFAPPYPYVEMPENMVYWDCFYFLVQYGLGFMLGLIIYKLTFSSLYKFFALALMIYSGCFFIYFNFLINKSLHTYIEYCNSKSFSLLFSIIIFILIFGLCIGYFLENIVKWLHKI